MGCPVRAFQAKHKAAWRQLEAANRLQRSQQSYSREHDQELISALKAAFPPIPQDRPAPLQPDPYQALIQGRAGHDSRVPIFVVGMPRSGSTLVEQILASHSQVFGAGQAPVNRCRPCRCEEICVSCRLGQA